MAVNVNKTKYILFRPRGQKINHNLEENGVLYNSNEIGGPVDPNKIFKLGRIHNDHPDKAVRTYKFLGIHLEGLLAGAGESWPARLSERSPSGGIVCLIVRRQESSSGPSPVLDFPEVSRSNSREILMIRSDAQ